MSSLLDEAKSLATRGTPVGARIEGLEAAAAAARGRLDDDLVDDAQAVVDRATGRLRLSATHTVVAVAGATGSGKSSTFNALTGLELSAVGVRRPTTSWASACIWGRDGAEELLEWLGIPPRHQTMRDSMLDSGRRDSQSELDGVVLLDLPDHDSTEVAHHLEVDRLVDLADLLVWILDPQKYADAAIHDRYLAPSAGHQDVLLVVLNQIDTVPEDRRQAMLDDVRRLLDADGLDHVPVLAVSARHGTGVAELKDEIARRAAEKRATRTRIDTDVQAVATRMAHASGEAPTPVIPAERVASLDDAFAEAAGVPTVVEAVERSTRARVGRATAWPPIGWLAGVRSDPLQRLHLDLGPEGRRLTGRGPAASPEATQVQRARVDAEVRSLADDVAGDLARPWADSVRRASTARLDDLGDRLNAALTESEIGRATLPWWAHLMRILQWLLLAAALGGLVWTGVLAGAGKLTDSDGPQVAGVSLALILLVGGVVLGLLVGLIGHLAAVRTARHRAQAADERLRAAVGGVSRELVVAPVEDELAAYAAVRDGLDAARAG
jgi:GTPase Era involved in 16S rRNA processing